MNGINTFGVVVEVLDVVLDRYEKVAEEKNEKRTSRLKNGDHIRPATSGENRKQNPRAILHITENLGNKIHTVGIVVEA